MINVLLRISAEFVVISLLVNKSEISQTFTDEKRNSGCESKVVKGYVCYPSQRVTVCVLISISCHW